MIWSIVFDTCMTVGILATCFLLLKAKQKKEAKSVFQYKIKQYFEELKNGNIY